MPNTPTPAPPLFHVASPLHGHGGPNLCGAPRDPDAQFGGLDGAYRAHVEGWADIVPAVCPDCLRVAGIAMGADQPPPVFAWSGRLDALPPERRAEVLAELRGLAELPSGQIMVVPPALPVLTLAALRAVLLFHSAEPWTPERRAEWVRLTGGWEATTRALCDAVRRALADAGEDRV